MAHFEVWSIDTFPYGQIKMKILESPTGRYTGVPNIAAKSRVDGSPDWIAGHGKNISEALEDAINNLLQSIAKNEAASEEDFTWSAPEGF